MSAPIDFRLFLLVKHKIFCLSWSVSFSCLFNKEKGEKEMKISVLLYYVQTLYNNSRQHTTTCNRVSKWTQQSNNPTIIERPTMLHPFAQGLTHKSIKRWLYNGCRKVNLSGPLGNFLFYVILTIFYFLACGIVHLKHHYQWFCTAPVQANWDFFWYANWIFQL